MNKRFWGSLAMVLVALPAAAQQTGTLTGKVTGKNGQGIAGVRVDVTANVLPQPKRVLTNESGEYRLPFLPPGEYVLTYTHADKLPQKRAATVLLGQTSTANVVMADTSVAGTSVEVVAEKATIVDATSTEIKSSFSSEVINALPVGQDYRDLVKLIPGVTYTQDAIRGPSAGGSGQDNIAQLDGVNVNLPLFGTMSATPSGHDIDQITILKGGADATGFNRSAGYTINSVSKSGTNTFTGELSYQILPDNLVAKRIGATAAVFEQEKTYAILNVGGPILQDKLFF
ncbi:MAG: TonB-dependent receptor, partial [Acidobacteriota bacterium]|nr:TonB-dependent receptor [Acidobacteriota bacterium]